MIISSAPLREPHQEPRPSNTNHHQGNHHTADEYLQGLKATVPPPLVRAVQRGPRLLDKE
ncbi:hypothetical protein E2C01_083252 [Portunus trituberculatus]|uniref:Uncharacterized protein n=1 Tax=Portunus trituberculatus TaxID=210409 RepID=A0A5B7IRY8_PORTR|nr:hypothetical protein [Portunus trituberculatus]